MAQQVYLEILVYLFYWTYKLIPSKYIVGGSILYSPECNRHISKSNGYISEHFPPKHTLQIKYFIYLHTQTDK